MEEPKKKGEVDYTKLETDIANARSKVCLCSSLSCHEETRKAQRRAHFVHIR